MGKNTTGTFNTYQCSGGINFLRVLFLGGYNYIWVRMVAYFCPLPARLVCFCFLFFCFVCLWFYVRPTREFFTHLETLKGCTFWRARHSWPLTLACNTDHPFIMVIFEDPWHSHLLPCKDLAVDLSQLRSVSTGDQPPLSCMRGDHSLFCM